MRAPLATKPGPCTAIPASGENGAPQTPPSLPKLRRAGLYVLAAAAPALMGLGLPAAGCILAGVFLLLLWRARALDDARQRRPMLAVFLACLGLAAAVDLSAPNMPNFQFQATLAGLMALVAGSLIRSLAATESARPYRDVVFRVSYDRAMVFLVAAALLLRLAYVMQSSMTFLFLDESKTLGQPYDMLRTGDLLPTQSVYKGGVNYYPLLAVYAMAEMLLRLLGYASDYIPSQKWLFFALGRTYFAVLASTAIALLYQLGKKSYSKRAGLLAALVMAFNAEHLDFSYFPKEDHVVLVMSLLVALMTVRWLCERKPGALAWAGVFTGLAAGSKLTGAMILAVPLLALIFPPKDAASPGETSLGTVAKRALMMCGIALAVFLAFNPVYYLNTDFVVKSYLYALQFMTVSMFGVNVRIGEHLSLAQYYSNIVVNLRGTADILWQSAYKLHLVWIIGLGAFLRRTRIALFLIAFTVVACTAMLVYNYPGYRFFLPSVFFNALILGIGLDWLIENITLKRLRHAPGLLLTLVLLTGVLSFNLPLFTSRFASANPPSAIAREVNEVMPAGSEVLSNRFMAFHINPNRYEVASIWMLGHPMGPGWSDITPEVVDGFDYVAIGEREYHEEDNPRIPTYDYIERTFEPAATFTATNPADNNLRYHLYRNPRSTPSVSHYVPASAATLLPPDADFPLVGRLRIYRNMALANVQPQPDAEGGTVALAFSPVLPDAEAPHYWPSKYELPLFSFVTRDDAYDQKLQQSSSVAAAVSLPAELVRARPDLRFDLRIANPQAADSLNLVIDGESAEGVILGRKIIQLFSPTHPPVGHSEINLAKAVSEACLMPSAAAFVKLRFIAPQRNPVIGPSLFCTIGNPVLARGN